MAVALSVRVSTTRPQQTQTVDQQLARLRAYVATQPDWHLAEEHIYRDDGYSGAKLHRPGLDRLRDRAALAVFERGLLTAPAPDPGGSGRVRTHPDHRPDATWPAGVVAPRPTAALERTPCGYVMDPERPRDPRRLQVDPVKAAVITQISVWYIDPHTPASLYGVAKRRTDDQSPTPHGGPRRNVASVRGILRVPVLTGTAYSERTHPVPARIRQSA
jgi:site-specific DNA recombinase